MLTADSNHSAGQSVWPLNASRYLLWIGIYFALHTMTRALVSQNLQLDEAEQLVLTQDWLLGYGSQPPLYTWIQKLFFEFLGVNILALSVFKNLCLWTIYAFVYFTARAFLSERLAVIASFSLLFIPQLVWESQRDQTHLVLATAFAASTLYVFIKAAITGKTRWFLLFGFTTALGVLSKYNFAILPVSLLIGALLTRRIRSRVWNIQMLSACVVFLTVVAPHLLWAMDHQSLVTSQAYKFEMQSTGGWLTTIRIMGRFLGVTLAFVATPVLVFVLLFLPALKQCPAIKFSSNDDDYLKFLIRAMAVGLVIVLVVALACRVTNLRDRWLQPLLFPLPVVLVGMMSSAFNHEIIRRFCIFASVVAITVLFAINGTVFLANVIGRSHNLNFPFETLSARIRQGGFNSDIIVADGFFLGGNLKMHFPKRRIVVPQISKDFIQIAPHIVVWRSNGSNLPPMLDATAREVVSPAPQILDLPSNNGPKKSERIGIIMIQPAQRENRALAN